MARKLTSLKPQDVLILLKLISSKESSLRQVDLTIALGLSIGEVSYGIQRLKASKLLNESGEIQRSNVLEFLVHAVKYLIPAQLGKVSRGIPTSHSAAPLSSMIQSKNSELYVLDNPDGTVKGHSVNPIYKTAAEAARKDEKLHQLIALVDAIRIGRVRERKLAMELLEKEVKG